MVTQMMYEARCFGPRVMDDLVRDRPVGDLEKRRVWRATCAAGQEGCSTIDRQATDRCQALSGSEEEEQKGAKVIR